MPKYFPFAIYGYYLYFTSHCIVEAFHAHASNKGLTESGSAKFFIKENGDVVVMSKGRLSQKTINRLCSFIKTNYREMYDVWRKGNGKPEFFGKDEQDM